MQLIVQPVLALCTIPVFAMHGLDPTDTTLGLGIQDAHVTTQLRNTSLPKVRYIMQFKQYEHQIKMQVDSSKYLKHKHYS